MCAARAGATGMVRRYGEQPTAGPSRLVLELATEFEPSLIPDGLIEPGLGADVLARPLDAARCGLAHVEHLQVFDTYERVVFADRCRSFVQEIFAGVGDAGVNLLDAGLGLLPVAADFGLPRLERLLLVVTPLSL